MFDDLSFAPVHIDAPVQPVLLPHVPSKLIRLALDDLLKVEQDDLYLINMLTFHVPKKNRCVVCAAGAVMSMTLGADWFMYRIPADFNFHNERALEFITACATFGCPASIMTCVGYIGAHPIQFDEFLPPYSEDRAGFHASRRALADAFEASGQ